MPGVGDVQRNGALLAVLYQFRLCGQLYDVATIEIQQQDATAWIAEQIAEGIEHIVAGVVFEYESLAGLVQKARFAATVGDIGAPGTGAGVIVAARAGAAGDEEGLSVDVDFLD